MCDSPALGLALNLQLTRQAVDVSCPNQCRPLPPTGHRTRLDSTPSIPDLAQQGPSGPTARRRPTASPTVLSRFTVRANSHSTPRARRTSGSSVKRSRAQIPAARLLGIVQITSAGSSRTTLHLCACSPRTRSRRSFRCRKAPSSTRTNRGSAQGRWVQWAERTRDQRRNRRPRQSTTKGPNRSVA